MEKEKRAHSRCCCAATETLLNLKEEDKKIVKLQISSINFEGCVN